MNYHPDAGEKVYTFDDVQGVDEAKEEVQEVVEFLKNPEKFQRLGARLPTGVCCSEGTWGGSTLLSFGDLCRGTAGGPTWDWQDFAGQSHCW